MGKTAYDAYRYSFVVVLAFWILGNILVIMSIQRQKKVLKNNYYFLVLHLAMCDLGALIIYLVDQVSWYFLFYSIKYCFFSRINYFFQATGIGMMLIISVLRYRGTVHPLKPAIGRLKLKVVCGLVYLGCFIVGYGTVELPLCFIHLNDVAIDYDVYHNVYIGYFISCFYFFPEIFMAVAYYKISRTVIKQNKHMKSICSNPVRQSAPGSSFNINILKFIRNRRTSLPSYVVQLEIFP
jgi:hypothetical protein